MLPLKKRIRSATKERLSMNNARVLMTAVGSYLPAKIVSNEDLSTFVDTDDMWIRRRTGIAQRHLVGEGETTADLAQHAAKKALKNAGLSGGDIDLIIVATTTPDNTFPSTATKLQHLIGAKRAIAFDVQAVCAGFVYALDIAEAMIQSGRGRRALVVGAKVSQNCWIGKTGPLVSYLVMELVQWFWNFLKILRIGGFSRLSCILMVLIVTFCMWMVAHPATRWLVTFVWKVKKCFAMLLKSLRR